ncbi:MAG: hypothetical protein AB1810_02090 [Pseudomonadota bacterium]
MKKIIALMALTCVAALTACSDKGEQSSSESQQQAAPAAQAQAPAQAPAEQAALPPGHPPMQQQMPGHPPMAGMDAPQPGGAQHQGKVVKVTHAAGYTYIEVDVGGRTTWVASAPQNIKSGSTISWGDGAVMQNFTSKTLRQTFDEITFVSAVNVVSE